MKTVVRVFLLVLALPFAARAANPVLPIDHFESDQGWSALGRVRVESTPDGHRGRGLKLTVSPAEPGGQQMALIQGPNAAAAQAWERGPREGLNAFVFHARCDAPVVLQVALRVRSRTVAGLEGVQGVLQATVALSGGPWRQYSVRFDEFKGPTQLLPVGDAIFRQYWPQVQFQVARPPAARAPKGPPKPVHIWLDDLAFGIAAQTAATAEPPVRHPGQDRVAEVTQQFPPAATTRVAPVATRRASGELRTQWTFVPWQPEAELWGTTATVSLPHVWPGRRDYVSGWYLRDLEVPDLAGRRLVLRLERVPFFCAAYVNGRPVGEHGGGFTPMEFDLTPALTAGRNRLALYVRDVTAAVQGNRAVFSLGVMQPDRIHPVGGIHGRAWLESRPSVHVAAVFAKPSTRHQRLEVECELLNANAAPARVDLRLTVREWRTGQPTSAHLPTQTVELAPGERRTVTATAHWSPARPWSPEHPELHVVRAELVGAGAGDVFDQRFGFREFWIEGGRFILNGTPIRLRGESAFRDHTQVPLSLHRGYLTTTMRAWKEAFGVNAFRLHAAIASQPVLEVADEVGLLLIHQSSLWSSMGAHYARGGAEFLANTRQEFAEWIRRDRNHPSVVIWDVENEQLRSSKRHDYATWVRPLDDFVRAWDTTRPISHSGAGWYEPGAEVFHVHMEEHYTKLFELWLRRPERPLINGEYWIGGRGEGRLPSSLEIASQAEYTQEELRLYHQAIIEQRAYGVSGVMPFTVSSVAFAPLVEGTVPIGPAPADDPDPRPATVSARQRFNPGWLPGQPAYRLEPNAGRLLYNALGPVTAFYWPRHEAATAGTVATRTVVVCNDSETPRTIEVRWGSGAKELGRRRLTLAPAAQERITVPVPAPAAATVATLFVEAVSDGLATARDELPWRGLAEVAPAALQLRQPAYCTDPRQELAPHLARLGIATQPTRTCPPAGEDRLWIIAPDASDRALDAQAAPIRQFLERGGRILCLAQAQLPKWSPVRFNSWASARQAPTAFLGFGWRDDWKEIYTSRHAPIYAPGHPVFAGLTSSDLRWWDRTDGRVADDALARPAATGAIARGNWRPLLGASRRENLSLVEVPVGRGLLVFCPAHVVRQSDHPEARLLLANLLRYLDRADVTLATRRVFATGTKIQEAARLLTGAELPTWQDGAAADLILAGPGADANALMSWARRTGGTVVILSAQVTGQLPGFAVSRNERHTYMAARGEPHPLFWGLAMASFEDHQHPAVQGAIARHPPDARVLLRGLAGPHAQATPQAGSINRHGIIALDATGPAAVAWPVGAATVIATTLEPFASKSAHAAEILGILLTNAGVPLAPPLTSRPRVRALRTVPLTLDGRLDDWTNDIEDRNVSPYRHAEPVVLGADTLVHGQAGGDQRLSGIVYFLWNDAGLHVAGLTVGGDRLVVRLGAAPLNLTRRGDDWQATLGAATLPSAAGSVDDLRQFPDGRYLTFAEIDERVGNVRPVRRPVRARSFELLVPWPALGGRPEGELPFAIEVHGPDGATLRLPSGTEAETGVLVLAP